MKATLAAIALFAASTSVAAVQDALPDGTPLEPGVSLRIYEVGTPLVELPFLVPGQSPNESRLLSTVHLERDSGWSSIGDLFYTMIDGWLVAPVDGTYEFELRSDDGSRLVLDGRRIIEMNRPQSPTSARGTIELKAGLHPILIEHFDGGGGEELHFSWRPPGAAAFEIVPTSALRTIRGQVRPVSPGPKKTWNPADARAAGDGRPLDAVHPSFDHRSLRTESFRPRVGGIDHLADGRIVLCAWEPSGGVYIVDARDPSAEVRVRRIAAGLAEPLGLVVVDGRIFVLQKQELTELIDHDGDDVIDEYRCVADGWNVSSNFHEFAFGLVADGDDFLANLAIAIDPGGRSTKPQVAGRGETIRIRRDGTHTTVTQGLRTPNGIGRGGDGRIYITDNQGDWLPSSKLMLVEDGAFFASQSVLGDSAKNLPVTPPVVWLPQGEIGNSPSQPAPLLVGPWTGQTVHGDVTHGGLKRVFVETIDGVAQGAVFRFTQGLEAGINRVVVAPDGAFIVGGIGASGDWGQTGKARFGLERLAYNGTPVFEPLAVRAKAGGLEIEFTTPLAAGVGARAEDYAIASWRYEPTEQYGGPKLDERTHEVRALAIAPDRRRVYLALPDLAADTVVHVRLFDRDHWKDVDGRLPWTTEAWYTMNRLPGGDRTSDLAAAAQPSNNRVSPDEAAAGWIAIFDGASFAGWKTWKGDASTHGAPRGWSIDDGAMLRSGDGGDLTSIEDFADFELRYEWRVSEGGNSGVMYRATEDRDYPWETGAEMQVLDDARHPDGRSPLTSAGSNYALHAPPGPVARPAGAWNTARILAVGPKVTYWLNGVKTAEFDVGSEDWKRRVKASKFDSMKDYATRSTGKIVLQDHGDRVWYRNVLVRRIGAGGGR
jgi:cytochrome c